MSDGEVSEICSLYIEDGDGSWLDFQKYFMIYLQSCHHGNGWVTN